MIPIAKTIRAVRQPKGGFLNPNKMTKLVFHDNEKISSPVRDSIIRTVKALCRYAITGSATESFASSIKGADILDCSRYASELLQSLDLKFSDECILSAYQLIHFDSAFLSGPQFCSPPRGNISTEDVRTMVKRTLKFFDACVPPISIAKCGGFASEDAFCIVEGFEKEPSTKLTLKLVAEFLLCHQEGRRPEMVIIFNPKTNSAFTYVITEQDKDMLKTVFKCCCHEQR